MAKGASASSRSLCCDEKSHAKQLPLNERAIGLAAACGAQAQQFRGDCYVSRYFDDDDAWVRQDLTLAIGANNLFNNYPDAVGIFNAATGAGQYPGTSPIGFTGGSYYGRIQWEF